MRANFADVSVQSWRMVQDGFEALIFFLRVFTLQEPDITSLWFITLMELNYESIKRMN